MSNIKHFEDFWNEAEDFASKEFDKEDVLLEISNIKEALSDPDFTKDKDITEKLFGKILYNLCSMSRKLNNLNSAKVLFEEIQNAKMRKLETFEG